MTLSETKKQQFVKEGYIIVPDFLESKELDDLRRICDAEIKKTENEMQEKGIKKDRINVYKKKYFISNPRKTNPTLKKIIFSEKFSEVCKATIGDTAYLHNEQFVVKMTDSNSNFAWHQDSGYSVYQGGAKAHKPYLTCWVALDDMSKENGTISILPFSRSPSRDLIKHEWDQELNAMVGYKGGDPGDLVEVSKGTLVAFSSFLLHKSGANNTNKPRRSYFVAFTPELFFHSDESIGVYNSGEPLIENGILKS